MKLKKNENKFQKSPCVFEKSQNYILNISHDREPDYRSEINK